ncbi:hypothetical protein ACFL96_11605 [Thermoproteota archaeon]
MEYELSQQTDETLENCLSNGDLLPQAMKAHYKGEPVFQSRFKETLNYMLSEAVVNAGDGYYF